MKCQICRKDTYVPILSLGNQPLANKYPANKTELKKERKYPLDLIFCKYCKIVKIKKIINSKEMFEKYFYLSSINQELVNHFNNLAILLKGYNFVVDIGSNDGILLKPLKKNGVKSIGIDPSKNVGKIANKMGFKTLIGFFSKKIVQSIISKYGNPDAVVASSVFTHIQNPKQFCQNIKNLLSKGGLLILEIEYLSSFLKKNEFERFYFDRPYYYSLKSIKILFESLDMSLTDVQLINTHGSSLRCFIRNKKNIKPKKSVKKILDIEKNTLTIKSFNNFNLRINYEIQNFKKKLLNFKAKNKLVIGYGCPARVSTITNYGNINSNHIKYIIDDSPLKQNKLSPGSHIPIVKMANKKNDKFEIIIVFAYEYFKYIKKKFKNKKVLFYKPIPFKILNE